MAHVMVEVDRSLLEDAGEVGRAHGRSAPEQLRHWARVGRELVAPTGADLGRVQRALDGDERLEALGPMEQAVVKAERELRAAERA